MPPFAQCALFIAALCISIECSAALVGHSTQDGAAGGREEDTITSAIERSSRAAAEAVMDALSERLNSMKSELATQLEGVQTDLESQLERLESRLMTRTRRVETHVDDVTAAAMSQLRGVQTALTTQLAGLAGRLQDTQTQIESQLVARSDAMFSRLVDVQSQLLTVMLTPRDCSDLPGSATSGVYLLWPSPNRPVPGYCDLATDGGNWTVIQRRVDTHPRQSFDLSWEAYGRGFGALLGEFWWGNENLYRLTAIQGRHYELRVELESSDGERRVAQYHSFQVASVKDGFRLTVAGYSGDAGDGLASGSGQMFSTGDRDQDESEENCAALWEAGWWYGACPRSNLNGPYLTSVDSGSLYGVEWPVWQEAASLSTVEMKIRPTESPATGVVREP